MATGRDVMHVVDLHAPHNDALENHAPHIRLVRIPCAATKQDWTLGPTEEELGDTSKIKMLVCYTPHFRDILEAGITLPSLKWVHTLNAGVDGITNYFKRTGTKPNYIITRSNIGSECVSEYVVGQMLATHREFYTYQENQKKRLWERTFPGRNAGGMAMHNLTVVLLGVGYIGKKVAAACRVFGMKVIGVTRSPVQGHKGSPDVDEYTTSKELGSALERAHYVVNMLPSTGETRGLLGGEVLGVCRKKKPVFINVGRGDIISEDTIIKALRSEWLSGAVLDVFPVEPLPADSPLWSQPGVTITPHNAMDIGEDVIKKSVGLILENYSRFKNNDTMIDVVDVERGY